MTREKNIIRRLKERDEEAFEIIYFKYVKLVFHVIFIIVENKDDTNDLVQDTFMKMMAAIDTFNLKNNFKYWLLQIAKNNAYDFLKKYNRIIHEYDIENMKDVNDNLVNQESDFYNILSKYNNLLKKDEYDIITLHLFQGLKFKEIAHIYGRSTSSVNNIYSRGIHKIRKYIKEVEPSEES